jgi:hypothetical protein
MGGDGDSLYTPWFLEWDTETLEETDSLSGDSYKDIGIPQNKHY